MAKMFPEIAYTVASRIQPYWLRATQTARSEEEVSLLFTLSPDTWSNFVQVAEYWDGPISATLHASSPDELDQIRKAYHEASFSARTDIHLIETTRQKSSNMLSRNTQRNVARLYARTEFVCEIPSDVLIPVDLKRVLELHKESYLNLLRQGDILVLPTFGHLRPSIIPTTKAQIVELILARQLASADTSQDWSARPSDYSSWINATSPYAVENYDMYYEPVTIESKTIQPWCPERFYDNRAACALVRYLTGSQFFVLPNAFAVKLEKKANDMDPLENGVNKRMFGRFYREQCVNQARQLDALGLWQGSRSSNIRQLCPRVIKEWSQELLSH
ncbi:hypothetical protein EC973_001676 [Apophysomyces ossiformis]|uniref:Uncharacterized protein n=1 Tax=Apophysomyces ossiformis TaxID=679940 RepID=A0A8H7BU32_9FUNG|nr:hypothetical protein EC973_001676 [Apophysomyces ossiformis]